MAIITVLDNNIPDDDAPSMAPSMAQIMAIWDSRHTAERECYNTRTGRFISNPKRVAEAMEYPVASYRQDNHKPAEVCCDVDTPVAIITNVDWRTARALCRAYHQNAEKFWSIVDQLDPSVPHTVTGLEPCVIELSEATKERLRAKNATPNTARAGLFDHLRNIVPNDWD